MLAKKKSNLAVTFWEPETEFQISSDPKNISLRQILNGIYTTGV